MGNNELQWNEGATRGYCRSSLQIHDLINSAVQIHLSASNVTTKYYGISDVRTRNTEETLLATFTVQSGANKIQRPVAGGQVAGGVLKSQAMGGSA